MILESSPGFFFKLISDYFPYCLLNCALAVQSCLEILLSGSFNKSCSRKVGLFFAVFHILSAILITMSIILNREYSISLVFICFLPLSYKSAQKLFALFDNFSCCNSIPVFRDNTSSTDKFNGLNKFLVDLFNSAGNMSFESYVMNKDSIIFESIFTEH